jgi:phosphoglycolate phosphatase-like HAD superfamily hydrolase
VAKYEVHEACVKAINAGADIVLLRDEAPLIDEGFEKMVQAVKSGELPEERLNDAVTRTLSVKYDYGLFKNGNIADESSESLEKVLNWSIDVTHAVEKIVHGLSPIPGVNDCLMKMHNQADIMVVSQTPLNDLKREWQEHAIDKFTCFIAGQEYGTKSEHFKYGAIGKYDADKILMIGDAPGDKKAAKDNGVLFYPIIAGKEEESWRRFNDEALNKFFNGSFAGKYEQQVVQEFEDNLPSYPAWQD